MGLARQTPESLAGWLLVAIGLLLGGTSSAVGQAIGSGRLDLSPAVQLDRMDSSARAHLQRVKAFLAEKQWDEAVETLRQVMARHADRLAPVTKTRYVPVRDYGHRLIAALPSEALALYRARVDPLARQWYEQASTEHDSQQLFQIVEQLFCSSWGDDALLRLGDLAIERGEYSTARRHLERISPLLKTPTGRSLWQALVGQSLEIAWPSIEPLLTGRPQQPTWLAYPDSDIPLAEVRARLALVSLLEGNRPRAEVEIEVLRRLHPDARGLLAGREVNYAQRLQALLKAADDWPVEPAPHDWPTFAGAPQRAGPTPTAFRLAGPAWPAPVAMGQAVEAHAESARRLGLSGRRVAEELDGLLSFHPVVADGRVFFANQASEVFAFDLATGKPAWPRSDAEKPGCIYQPSHPTRSPGYGRQYRLGVPRFTLTVHQQKLLVRLGSASTSWPAEPAQTEAPGYLVCLDLKSQGKLDWEIRPDSPGWAFEGTPLCKDGKVYVAMRRADVRPQAHVACFDLATGRRLWRTFLSGAETLARGQTEEITHTLLTMQDGTIYCNTNLGAVAALRAADGRLRWVSLYPRVTQVDLSRRAAHFYRDLNPCVYHQGVLFVAPTDSRHVLALDALSGQMLWASDLPSDVVHLLGVSGDYLVASGDRLWWLDARAGKVRWHWPDNVASGLRGYGRGTLAGDQVFWPTRERVFVFGPGRDSIEQAREPIRLADYQATGGNLVIADGYLLIAGREQLFCLAQVPRRREALRREISNRPGETALYLQLAECDEAMDDHLAAIAACRTGLAQDQTDQHWQGRPVSEMLRERLAVALGRQAQVLAAERQADAAVALLREALAVEVPPAIELATRVQLATLYDTLGNRSAVVAEYQAILDRPRLRTLPVERTPEWSVQAAIWAREHSGLNASPVPVASPSDESNPGDAATRLTLPLQVRWSLPQARLAPVRIRPIDRQVCLTRGDQVECIDRQDGSLRWKKVLEHAAQWWCEVDDNAVLASEQHVECLHTSTGARRWAWRGPPRLKAEAGFSCSRPATDGRRLYVRVGEQQIVALDLETGAVRWRYTLEHGQVGNDLHPIGEHLVFQQLAASSTPAKLGSTLVLQASDGRLLHRMLSGEEHSAWRRPPVTWDGPAAQLIVVDQQVRRLDVARGEVLWSRKSESTASEATPDVLAAEGVLIYFPGDRRMVRLDPATGALAWEAMRALGPQTLAYPRRSAMLAGRSAPRLYCVSGGDVQAFGLADGQMVWSRRLAITSRERLHSWSVGRVGDLLAAYRGQFGQSDTWRLMLLDPATGRLAYRSPDYWVADGAVQVFTGRGDLLVASADRVWRLATDNVYETYPTTD